MLHSEVYIGKWHYGKHRPSGLNSKDHWVPLGVPDLVSVEMWERAQEQSQANKIMAPRHVKNEYLMPAMKNTRAGEGEHSGRRIET
jgi:hypothetical protein